MKDERALSGEHKQALQKQVFDASHPGSLLHDFAAVLEFVGTAGVKSTGKYNLLPIDSLAKLNALLAHPLQLQLKRPRLQSHPYLLGLNLILRTSGIGRVEGAGEHAKLAVDPEMLLGWDRLNETERYFNLLEAWLIRGRRDIVGESGRGWGGESFIACLSVWRGIPAAGAKFTPRDAKQLWLPGIGRDFLTVALMDLFGLLQVEHPARPLERWSPCAVHRTRFGDGLLTAVSEHYFEFLHADSDEAQESSGFGLWQSYFRPYFPEWRENLELPEIEPRDGTFIFRVSLGKVWRRLAVPSTSSLDDLVFVILNAMNFDHDHLYEVTYRDRFGAEATARRTFSDDGPFAADVCIGELPLMAGQSMRLTYDFGDNWPFDVKLERIDPPNRRLKSPRLLERHGKAPKQYDSYF